MNSKSMRRLAADHSALYTGSLPPNFLFDPHSDGGADLTSLDILLAGPVGTPYASGVWRLHLDIPTNYPTAPPTAQFRTRLWHPNIDEATGAVCVETLKRDWSSTLKLKDVLVTISCLLIQPNPASALNEAAGKLASEDWDGFCRRAKLMTEIHAAVPNNLAKGVLEAQKRGDEQEAESSTSNQPTGKGKQKERLKATPSAPKIQRVTSEDEENTRRREKTQERESDTESDWIPAPNQTPRTVSTRQYSNNVLGIKGLDDNLQLDTPPKRIFESKSTLEEDTNTNSENLDPFITVTSKRTIHNKRIHNPDSLTASTETAQPTSQDTPELLKFADKNPFAAVQPNNQASLLSQEFSHSWNDLATLHGTKMTEDGPSKLEVKKRLAGDDFVTRQKWEAKKFKKTGYDLGMYNRGDWEPRTGLGRL